MLRVSCSTNSPIKKLASQADTFLALPARPLPSLYHRRAPCRASRLRKTLESYEGWEAYTGEVPKPASFPSKKNPLANFTPALHAAHHGIERVIYVAPYTSIIEQTAQVFTSALGEGDVLEHHSGFDWDKAEDTDGEIDADGLKKLRHAAENWDVPAVVITAVQFFESLFSVVLPMTVLLRPMIIILALIAVSIIFPTVTIMG
jgi:hypothetical protein